MSRAAKRRRTIAWARYFNRYVHLPDPSLGGTAAFRVVVSALTSRDRAWTHVRRQVKSR